MFWRDAGRHIEAAPRRGASHSRLTGHTGLTVRNVSERGVGPVADEGEQALTGTEWLDRSDEAVGADREGGVFGGVERDFLEARVSEP